MENTKKRLNFKDDFELLYLRHEYIEKARSLGKQLDSSMVQKYAGIVHTTAKIMFSKLKSNFQKVGFDEDDFVAITNMYMLSYMALYSIQTNKEELDSFLTKVGNPSMSEAEILRADRNRLINFLRQKLYHCSALFARKARNIIVGEDKRGFFASTADSVDVPFDMLIEDHKKYGYRKLTSKEFKKSKEDSVLNKTPDMTDKDGFKVFQVELLNQGLSKNDYELIMEGNKGMFYHPPDVTLQMAEEEAALEAFKLKFQGLPQDKKRRVLTAFIRNNKDNKHLKDELKLARKLLKDETIVV